MRLSTNRLFAAFAVTFAVLASACSGSDSPRPADAAADATTTADSSSSTATDATGTGTATSTQPDWVTDALEEQETIRYIANSGGVGVSYRSACEDAARIDGSWPEGAKLEIVLDDEAACADWTLLSDGDVVSWVRDRYIATTAPVTGSNSGSGSGGSSAGSTQVQVIDFFGNLIPTSQLWEKATTYSYRNTVIVAGCEQSWHPVGDSAISLSGTVIADPAPDGCGFGAVRLVPAYWTSTSP